MKRFLHFCLPVLALALLSETLPVAETFPTSTSDQLLMPVDSFDQAKALEMLRAEIAGKEKESAGSVFKNLELMGQMPAGRLLAVMEMGFARSLGVNCTHCHNPEAWDSDEKHAKLITRDMMKMVGKINNELLKTIEHIGGEDGQAVVNCTTCHRGQVVPGLNME